MYSMTVTCFPVRSVKSEMLTLIIDHAWPSRDLAVWAPVLGLFNPSIVTVYGRNCHWEAPRICGTLETTVNFMDGWDRLSEVTYMGISVCVKENGDPVIVPRSAAGRQICHEIHKVTNAERNNHNRGVIPTDQVRATLEALKQEAWSFDGGVRFAYWIGLRDPESDTDEDASRDGCYQYRTSCCTGHPKRLLSPTLMYDLFNQ